MTSSTLVPRSDRVLLPNDLGADAAEIYLVYYWARRARHSRDGVVYRDPQFRGGAAVARRVRRQNEQDVDRSHEVARTTQ